MNTAIVSRIVMTTKNTDERNSAELIAFYKEKNKKLEIKVKDTPDDLIDIEFYGFNEDSDDETLLDKIGIPYDKESNI